MLLIPGIIASSKLGAVGDFESIATVTVGAGNASQIEFTSIPSTFQHLQIRAFMKISSGGINPTMQFNNDTASNYIAHQLYGDGASAGSFSFGTGASMGLAYATTQWGGMIIDVLDYTSTNKNKTVRTLGGTDTNGGGYSALTSGLWFKTPEAINSIKISFSSVAVQYSHFALYGIRG